MFGLLIVFHLLICLALVSVVLMQSGKGGGLAGGAFGGSAQTVFGGRGATDFLTRATMVLAGLFFLTSLILALLSTNMAGGSKSLIQQEARKASSSAPAQLPGGQGQQGTGGAPRAPAAPSGGR